MPQRGQYSLRLLMAIMLWVGLTSAAVSVFGPGAMISGIAGGLLVFNAAGVLKRLQRGRQRAGLVLLAWVSFIVSFFLPAVMVFDPVLGWEAAWTVAESVLALPESVIDLFDYSFATCLTLANVMMSLSPLALLIEKTRLGLGLKVIFCLVAPAVFVCCFNDAEGLAIGFYLWAGSVMMTISVTRVSWPAALASMAAMFMWITVALTLS